MEVFSFLRAYPFASNLFTESSFPGRSFLSSKASFAADIHTMQSNMDSEVKDDEIPGDRRLLENLPAIGAI